MTGTTLCALCGKNPAIRNSHAIPKFAINWIKETSATGYLRQAIRPNVPKQDIDKYALLCVSCEGDFSKLEKKFVEGIFIPFLENNQIEFEYEDWLLKFAVSLAWRTAVVHLEDCRSRINPDLAKATDTAIAAWKNFLLQNNCNPNPYTHHLLFLKFISDAEGAVIPKEMHRYLLRSVDASLVANSTDIFAYTKLPGMIFCSRIAPPAVSGWLGTEIFEKGKISLPQEVNEPGWGNFLLNQAKVVMGRIAQISDRQSELIAQKIKNNPSRALNSKSRQVAELDNYWDEKQGRRD